MKIKPFSLNIETSCMNIFKQYNSICDEEHLKDVIDHSVYLEQNRKEIVQNFLSLALLDVSKEVFNDVSERLLSRN